MLAVFTAVLLGATPAVTPVSIPGGQGGIGFDDLGYSPALGRVVVPAGRTGQVDLVDPKTLAVESIGGFSQGPRYSGGHGKGTTSADVGGGLIFASDRGARQVRVVDARSHQALGSVPLEGTPDYVRWVEPLKEVWVTEPTRKQIEFFKVSDRHLLRVGKLGLHDGPESLVVDATRARAYTHAWGDTTFAIDLRTHAIAAQWKNGCEGSRGIALDEKEGWLFVGCDEGKAVTLDATTGATLSQAKTGAGVDIIAYAPALRHLYVPGGDSATLTVLVVGEKGKLTVLSTVPVAKDSHCATTDGAGDVFVCDPGGGRLLRIQDSVGSK